MLFRRDSRRVHLTLLDASSSSSPPATHQAKVATSGSSGVDLTGLLGLGGAPAGSDDASAGDDGSVSVVSSSEADDASSSSSRSGVSSVKTGAGIGGVGESSVTRGGVTVQVTSKYVRRELRKLTKEDREKFFESLHTIYHIGQQVGANLYGSKFRSIEVLVAEHLRGAASKECDHWHDDAGILTHHMGFTLELEQSLQSVDPSVAMPYWDYTADAHFLGDKWPESQIFKEEWFGAASPARADHVVDKGRWAFTPIKRVADGELPNAHEIRNAYGLLRSPWNANPVPYLSRHRYTLGVEDAGFSLPSCSQFKRAFKYEWLGQILSELNGLLHGPVHVMTGGHWFWDEKQNNVSELVAAAHLESASGFFLLSSKFLWRQGFLRCPEYCSTDTPARECTCSCPDKLFAHNGTLMNTPELLAVSGLEYLNNGWLRDGFELEANMTSESVWDVLCHVGHAGEMFTSAAPYDPLFWPLHGLAERFLTIKRLASIAGTTTLNNSWGYEHVGTLASDTNVVCDWSEVEGLHLPMCKSGTCPGHKSDDILPMGGFVNGTETYTNLEFYEFTAPHNTELPYVYDSFTKWEGCDAQNISFWRGVDDDDDL